MTRGFAECRRTARITVAGTAPEWVVALRSDARPEGRSGALTALAFPFHPARRRPASREPAVPVKELIATYEPHRKNPTPFTVSSQHYRPAAMSRVQGRGDQPPRVI